MAAIGFILVIYLSTHGYDRAVMVTPTWFLLLAWVVGGGLRGHRASSPTTSCAPALLGGLVLIVMLIGFTVMQHAFAGGAIAQGLVSDTERKALALAGSGDTVFDWDVVADKVYVSPEVETQLGLQARRAGRPGRELAGGDAPLRPRPLPRHARRRARAAARPRRSSISA